MTSTQTLVRDNSTLTNFKQWAKAISDFFTTCGWTQTSDAGQVNWSTIASVPGSGSFVYEIWKPADSPLTPFYLKVEYGTGNKSSNTNPLLRWSVGSGTDGAGNLTGPQSVAQQLPASGVNVTSTTTPWECHMSGDASRMGIMMWRDDSANSGGVMFAVQRSVNSSGAYTSQYVTLLGAGNGFPGFGAWHQSAFQQTVMFAGPVTTPIQPITGSGLVGPMGFASIRTSYAQGGSFNGYVPISPIFPAIGYFDNPVDIVALGAYQDFTEGATVVIPAASMPYGVSHTYIVGKGSGYFSTVTADATVNSGSPIDWASLLMRFD